MESASNLISAARNLKGPSTQELDTWVLGNGSYGAGFG